MRISIVMPTRNQAPFTRAAVNSVLQQKGTEVELIVQDACSDDGTAEILDSYGTELQWCREADRGQVDAIQRGFNRATGEIHAWLNSDDVYLPGALAHIAEAFAQDAELDFVYGDALEVDRAGRILTPNIATEVPNAARYLYSHNYICQPTLFIRAGVVAKVGRLRADLQWFMDYEWIGRFFLHGLRGRRLPAFLAVNREYPETKTNRGGWRRYRELVSVQRTRPGPRLLLRPAMRIYALEWVLKCWSRRRTLGRAPNAFEQKGHALLWRWIRPREETEIRSRFNQEWASRGVDSLEQIWPAASAADKRST